MKRTISAALLLTVLLTGCSLPALRTEQAVGPREQNDLYAAQTQRQADRWQPAAESGQHINHFAPGGLLPAPFEGSSGCSP